MSEIDRNKLVEDGIEVFNELKADHKDNTVINGVLRLLLESNRSLHYIESMSFDIERAKDIDLGLLLKCCLTTRGAQSLHEEQSKSIIQMLSHISESTEDIDDDAVSLKVDLMAVYCRCGAVTQAVSVLNSISGGLRRRECIQSVMRWLMDNGQSAESTTLCLQWLNGQQEVEHNDTTMMLLLRACSDCKRYHEAIEWLNVNINFDEIDRYGVELVNSMIAFYGECNCMDNAVRIFHNRSSDKRDTVTVNAMMTALSTNDRDEESLTLFWDLPSDLRDAFSYSIALRCCGNTVSLQCGQRIVDELESVMELRPDLSRNGMVRASVLAMYSGCGETESAVAHFKSLNISDFESKEQVPINKAMIDCHAKNGDVHSVMDLFRELWNGPDSELYRNDHAVISMVLSACSHYGLRDEAMLIFDDIKHQPIGQHPHVLSALYDGFSRKDSHEIDHGKTADAL